MLYFHAVRSLVKYKSDQLHLNRIHIVVGALRVKRTVQRTRYSL